MKKSKTIITLAAGVAIGLGLAGPAAQAAEDWLRAVPSPQTFLLGGQQVELEAYLIGGNNYVKLRDIGKLLDFDVSYDAANNAAVITPDRPYCDDEAAAVSTEGGTITLPTDGSRYIPQAGDVIRCDDGTDYTITDVSRYNANMFASGPLPELPAPACDYASFPAIELSPAEARHYQLSSGDYLFIRNLYETRRMQYTIQNLAGTDPETSVGGKLRYGSKGTPYVRIQLTIDPEHEAEAQSFWPWRESELTNSFHSCPIGTYQLEAWDVYKDGVFLYTKYRTYIL